MKIIFMPMLPLTTSDYEYLGIKYFCEKGYDVAVLETHQLLLPGYKESVNLEYLNFQNMHTPSSIEELIRITNSLSINDYIIFYLASKEAVSLLNQVKSTTKAKFVTYISGSIPSTSSPCGYMRQLRRRVMPIMRKCQYWFGIGTFETDLYFTGAPKDELIFPYLVGNKTKKIPLHSRDYEKCISAQTYTHDREYCVYLDTDAIDASDYVIFGNKVNKDSITRYHDKLINFFQWIQLNMNIEVVISAHPKSRIYQNLDSFKGVKVVHNKSASLVKDCKFVLNEGTTAVSFAVYFNKPMLFFTMNELDFFYNYACSFAKEFNKKIISINTLDTNVLETIKKDLDNKERYNYYKYNYLTYKDNNIGIYELIEKEMLLGR